MISIVLLAGLLSMQTPAPDPVDALIRRLAEPDLQVRDRAKAELFKMGPVVLEPLRKHLVAADPAVSVELKDIIAKLEREIVLGEFLGKPSLILLKADRMPLKEILAGIREQSKTPLLGDDLPLDDLVSVNLDQIPFFEAVDRVCRAHKGLRMKLENTFPPGEEIPLHQARIARGSPEFGSRKVDGQFAVELESLVVVRPSDFNGAGDSWCDLTIRGAWERGAQPVRASMVRTSATDDAGNVYTGQWVSGGSARKMYIPSRFQVRLDKPPPDSVKKFREISGVIELDFPTDVEILRLPDPATKIGSELIGAQFRLKLVGFRKVVGGYTCDVETEPRSGRPAWDQDLRLVDRTGKSYLGEYERLLSGDRNVVTREIRFNVPAGAEIGELRHTDYVGGRTRRIEWKFFDVPVRN